MSHTTQNLNNKRPNEKWAEDLNRHFSSKDIQLKRCSHCKSSEKCKSKSQNQPTPVSLGEDVEKRKPRYKVGGL